MSCAAACAARQLADWHLYLIVHPEVSIRNRKDPRKPFLTWFRDLLSRLFCVFLLFQTRLCVRLYILRSKQPSIGVADDFYWEALYECGYISGWSSVSDT